MTPCSPTHPASGLPVLHGERRGMDDHYRMRDAGRHCGDCIHRVQHPDVGCGSVCALTGAKTGRRWWACVAHERPRRPRTSQTCARLPVYVLPSLPYWAPPYWAPKLLWCEAPGMGPWPGPLARFGPRCSSMGLADCEVTP